MLSRRRFLGGGAAAASLLGARFIPPRRKRPTVAVVGAGLAGLTCAYELTRSTDARVTVYEAQGRLGGRVRTIRLAGEQFAEGGGTFISSGDRAVRRLADRLGLDLVDLYRAWPSGRTLFHFDGSFAERSEVMADRRTTARRAQRQFENITWPLRSSSATHATERFDDMTIAAWIDRYTPGGDGSLFAKWLRTYMETDYGTPVDSASALHVIAEFASSGRNYDERFTVRGGSDRLIRGLERRLGQGVIVRDAPLLMLADRRRPIMRFGGDGPEEIGADHVVLALPFTALRSVDLTGAQLSARKLRAIDDLGMGVGAKMSLQFRRDAWTKAESGESYSDMRTGSTWPGHAGMSGPQKILVSLSGIAPAAADPVPAHGPAPEGVVSDYLKDIEAIFPGASERFIEDQAYLDDWVRDPWTQGTYSYYPSGGFTDYAGIEQRAEGRIHFAGEHTARYGNRGTLNGAVASGIVAAREIAAAIG